MKDTYRSSLVFSIHGIRTKAAWQRALSETLSRDNIPCSSYNFGYYSLLRFLFQPSNKKMIDLFYEYYSEVLANHTDMIDLNNSMKRPSIVVHSFGSYILGYCMLKYPDVKFDKIILCGSILPTTFDWATLLVRDQVNRVLNEYGLDDIWAKVVGIFIPKTGKSGATGFQVRSVQIQEKRYDFFKHGDYFRGQHILTYWLPFLNQPPGQYFIRHGHDFEILKEFNATLDTTGEVIDKTCFGGLPHYDEAEVPVELALRWITVNPDIYTFLFDHLDDSVKGYINAMPVDDSTFEGIKSGLMQDNEITDENIIPFVKDQNLSIYLMSIAISPTARLANEGLLYLAFEKLVNGFVNKLMYYFTNYNIKATKFIAVGWTAEGKKLCRLLGMEQVGSDKFDNPIYLLDIESTETGTTIRQIESIKKLAITYKAFDAGM